MLVELARYSATAFEVAAVARIAQCRLVSRFPFFFALLTADLVGAVAALPFSVSSPEYRSIWMVRQPFGIILAILAANETIVRLSEGYPDFDGARQRLTAIAAVAGILIAAGLGWPEIRHELALGTLYGIFALRRAQAIATACAMAFIALFFSLAPAPARRNSVIHGKIFAAFTMIEAVGYYAIGHRPSQIVQICFSAMSMGCFIAWTALITRAGDVFAPLAPLTKEEKTAAAARTQAAFDEFEECLRGLTE